ncbi:MAG: AMP-binding protein [Hyphomicrobiaceae bacterium]|nr:AMP-binding protein [Hyphomicrobiaceae bacterium]
MSSHIFDNFLNIARNEPRRIFCIFRSESAEQVHTYSDAATAAGRYQSLLRSHGVDRDDVVVIMLDHSIDVMTSFIGATLCGAIPSVMPLSTKKQDPQLFWPAHKKLFERTGVKAIVTSPAGKGHIQRWVLPESAGRPSVPIIESHEHRDHPADLTVADLCPGSLALLQHSSGTTGLKKGVALSHEAVLAQTAAYASAIGFSERDRVASWLPLYHDMGLLTSFLMPAILGATIVASDPFEWVMQPHDLFAMIEDHKCQFTWMPNFAFEHLVRTDDPDRSCDLRSMKAFINCSEPCKKVTFDRFAAAFARHGVTPEMLQTCYAMAETVFAVTQTRCGQRVGSAANKFDQAGAFAIPHTVSVGVPISGMEIRILDADNRPLADGLAGQVAVRAPYLFSGYYRLPEDTQKAFADDWYLTGDIGAVTDGELYIVGRIKDVVVVHGKNIVAHEIESEIGAAPGVKPGRAVVFGVFNPAVGSEELVVVAEADHTAQPTEAKAVSADIRERVNAACGIYPSRVLIVEPGWLVKTTSGKISRSDNQRKYLEQLRSRS